MFLELGEAHVVINPLRPARAMLAHGGDAHGDTAHGDDAPRRAFAAARHRATPRREGGGCCPDVAQHAVAALAAPRGRLCGVRRWSGALVVLTFVSMALATHVQRRTPGGQRLLRGGLRVRKGAAPSVKSSLYNKGWICSVRQREPTRHDSQTARRTTVSAVRKCGRVSLSYTSSTVSARSHRNICATSAEAQRHTYTQTAVSLRG